MIGYRIKKLRTKCDLTLQELGDKLGFNYSNLSKIERGDRKPTLELLESLCEYFGVPMSYFFNENVESKWSAFIDKMESYDLKPEDVELILEGILKFIKK